MRIVLIGGSGTIGKRLDPALRARGHEVILTARTSGNVRVDITSTESITRMYEEVSGIDAVVGIAASGALDDFATLTEAELLENMRGKFFGQVNTVLIGQHYLNDGGSFTLTSGIFADQAWKGVTGGGLISGALHSFVQSAALELPRGLRANAVSPTLVAESPDGSSPMFPGMKPLLMDDLIAHYITCIEGNDTGRIIRAYG
jgi:NAD(P)-dependent dehydrogenase (short-subunit alcohol dehydrogenase family)